MENLVSAKSQPARVGGTNKGTVRGTGKNVEPCLVNGFGLFPCRTWQPLAGMGGWNKSE